MVPGEPHARAQDAACRRHGWAGSCTSRRRSRSSSSSACASPTTRRWRSRRCTSAPRSCPAFRAGSRGALVLRAADRPLRHRHRRRPADDRAHRDERGGVGGARRPAPLAGVPVRADDPLARRARSSSTSARSTAATATDWSPSSAATPGGADEVTYQQHAIPALRAQCPSRRAQSGLDKYLRSVRASRRGQVVYTNSTAARRASVPHDGRSR